MKNISSALTIICVLSTTGVMSSANNFELRGSGIYFSPEGAAATGSDASALEEIKWDSGTGFEVQGIYWIKSSPWGFGASLGKATWDIDDYEDIRTRGSSVVGDTLEGDADLTTFGLSAFYKLFTEYGASKKLSGAIAGGLQFVSFDSNIEGETGVASEAGIIVWDQTLEIDDSIWGYIAFDLSYALTETVNLFGQGGVQFDLDKGSVENDAPGLGTFQAGETELQALFGKAGLSISF
jgi:hypothetical protein